MASLPGVFDCPVLPKLKMRLLAKTATKFALMASLILLLTIVKAEETEFRVEKITAGFVYNFARLTIWPDLSKKQAVKLCIAAQPDFVKIFQQFSDKRVAGRTLEALEYSKEIHNDCQILFIDTAMQDEIQCQHLRNSPHLLTISNIPGFAHGCGIIELFKENNRLRFEINIDAANRAKLRLSSYLYKLARILRDKDK